MWLVCSETMMSRIGRPADAAIAVARVYARNRKSDVVDDTLEFICRDLPTYGGFHSIDQVGRFFDSRASWRAHVQSKRPGIH